MLGECQPGGGAEGDVVCPSTVSLVVATASCCRGGLWAVVFHIVNVSEVFFSDVIVGVGCLCAGCVFFVVVG